MRFFYHLKRPKLLFWKLWKKTENMFLPKSSALRIYNQTAMALERDFDLFHPKTYNEKICYEKCFWRDPLATECADKVLVRSYVTKKGLSNILIPSYGFFKRVADIPFDKIPKPYVIKINNDSGGVFPIFPSTTKREISIIKKKLNLLLKKKNYGSKTGEWVYDGIVPTVLVEKRINGLSKSSPVDYKIYCFSGKAKFIQTIHGRETGHSSFGFYDTKGSKLNIRHGTNPQFLGSEDPLFLQKISELVSIAEILSSPFPHVRVDLYIVGNFVFFGELTFFSTGGLSPFSPESFEEWAGSCFSLPTTNLALPKKLMFF
jgi:hypothetical protein